MSTTISSRRWVHAAKVFWADCRAGLVAGLWLVGATVSRAEGLTWPKTEITLQPPRVLAVVSTEFVFETKEPNR